MKRGMDVVLGLNCGEAERERVAMGIEVEGVGSTMVSE